MKRKMIIVLSLAVFTFMGFLASQVISKFRCEMLQSSQSADTGNPATDQPTQKFYNDKIDKYTSIYFLKSSLLGKSRFNHQLENAKRAQLKAIFFKTHKNQLAKEMIEQKIGKKSYHIENYLEKRFRESSLTNECVADLTPAASE